MPKRFVNPSLFALFGLVLLIWQLGTPALAQSPPQSALGEKNILVLNAYQSNLPSIDMTNRGITSALHTGGMDARSVFFEHLDLARNPGPERKKLLAELMRLRYSQHRIDFIITVLPEALQFLLNEGRTFFPEAPILALYLFSHIEPPKTDRLIIQHSTKFDMIGTLESALKLVPGTKHVYVVSGASSSDKLLQDQARQDFAKWEGQLDFRYLSDMSFEQMLAEVSSAPPDTIVLFISLIADITGKAYNSRDAVQQLSRVSKAPIFGLYGVLLGYGIAGGFLADSQYIGAKAGEIALNILATGLSRDKISTTLEVPPVPEFDWRQLRHWNLNVDALPKGSIVINRELTLWDFIYYIIGTAAFCLAETALIIFFIVQRRRKRAAEEALREKTDELDQFFNISPDLLCIANTDGYFLRLNSAWEKILGYTREELMTKRFLDFVHPDDLNRTREVVSTLASQRKVFFFQNRYRCKDGTYRWLEWSAAPVGNLIYAAARNITERKEAEAETALARAELLHVERSSRLGELTVSLAHELNQPLAAILSSAQAAVRFLQSGTRDLNLFRTILQNIIEDDKRAAGVITSLRAMMKKEESEREPLNLNAVLDDVLKLFYAEAIVRKVTIERDFDKSLPPVLGDKIQLQQVVLNLFMNAAEALSESPNEDDKRKIILRTKATDHGIQVTVRDFGPGIDPARLDDIWHPFFTTKNTGLGMGLGVCRSIIQAHRGRISAENHPDGGAMFTFEIPIFRNP